MIIYFNNLEKRADIPPPHPIYVTVSFYAFQRNKSLKVKTPVRPALLPAPIFLQNGTISNEGQPNPFCRNMFILSQTKMGGGEE